MKRFVKSLVSTALGAATVLPVHAEIDVAGLKAASEKSLEADYPKLDALYKDIHAHPEIAFQEVKTAAKLAAEMRALGFEVTEQVGNNHSPLFAPVPKPTIETGVEAMTLAVLSTFDQHARDK
jgi:metal-dependent amidase/aminoacylase/carboxypeptidase family protein